MKPTIGIVVTARASFARVQTVLEALSQREPIVSEVVLLASASLPYYGDVPEQVKETGLSVSQELLSQVAGDSPYAAVLSTGLAITQLGILFHQKGYKAVVTVGDRYETLATAIAASYQHIPLVHIQGGERSGNLDDRVRDAVTTLADWHLVATERAKQEVLRLGALPDHVVRVGCPSIDLVRRAGCQASPEARHIVVMLHPETKEWLASYSMATIVFHEVMRLKRPVIFFGPNADPGSGSIREALSAIVLGNGDIRYVNHLKPAAFLQLLADQAACLVGNSSVGIRECSYMGIPVVNVGTRQEGRERGPNVLDVGWDNAVGFAIESQLKHGPYECSDLYGDGHAGETIGDLLVGLSTKENW